MLDFAALQSAVKEKLDEDRSIHVIETEAANLDAALEDAANLLGVSVRNLEYEVITNKASFLGIGEDICKIRAFETIKSKKARERELLAASSLEDSGDEDIEIYEDKDGEVFVQRRPDGVFIKVTPPEGAGKRAGETEADYVLKMKKIADYDPKKVQDIVNKKSGEYALLCEYERHDSSKDTTVSIEIIEGEMGAYMTISPPGYGGADLTYEEYTEYLQNKGVLFGINENLLRNLADKPIYHQKISVANGKRAIDGKDAYMEYYFDTEMNSVHIKENIDGKVDFKELNIIQNVLKDELLGKKMPPGAGEDGTTVTGRVLQAKAGADIEIPMGENVHLLEDGVTIAASINGQVVFIKGKINVEEMFVVEGSVNLKTGNIMFLGNVIVKGNVEEGFSVKASGNIEVHGYVDKANLNAEGDIVVNKGITGKEGTKIYAGHSVWTKFIENSDVHSADMIVVTDGIVNSNLSASKKILCNGKNATIVGGRIQAGESIIAHNIGSHIGNTPTLCEVGYDPLAKAKIDQLVERKKQIETEETDLEVNIETLESIKSQRGSLPEDKETYYKELKARKKALGLELSELDRKIASSEEYLKSIAMEGQVAAVANFYPGVIIQIKDQRIALRKEYKEVTFFIDGDIIRATKYVQKENDSNIQNLKPKEMGK